MSRSACWEAPHSSSDTGPGVPRWRRWLQKFISRIYCMRDPVLLRSVVEVKFDSQTRESRARVAGFPRETAVGARKNPVFRLVKGIF